LLLAKRPEFAQGDYEAAIRGALIDEDAVLLDTFNNLTTEPAVSGSTVALCFVNLTKGDLVVANLGDSHVILAERNHRTDHPSQIVSEERLLVPKRFWLIYALETAFKVS
jgi:serine/threonine protein phosphatase PrpC